MFLDDVLVHAATDEELLDGIDRTLGLLDGVGIKLQPKKCELYSQRLTWCGRELSAEGVGISPDFRDTLLAMPPPQTGADLQQFLAAANWVRGMIPEYARRVGPLQVLLNEVLSGLPRRSKVHAARVLLRDKGWLEEDGSKSAAALAYDDLKEAIGASVTNA